MRVAYWPGCVSRGFTPELHGSMAKVAPLLDIELVELDRACCTGAGVIAEHNQELSDSLNARTFALAQGVDGAAGLGGLALLLWKFKFLAVLFLTKAKFLFLGLTKASTFLSMLLSMDNVKLRRPVVPLVTNLSASAISDPAVIKYELVGQVTAMVRWRESVLFLGTAEVEEVAEIGTGRVLAGLVRRIDPALATRSVGTPSEVEALIKEF